MQFNKCLVLIYISIQKEFKLIVHIDTTCFQSMGQHIIHTFCEEKDHANFDYTCIKLLCVRMSEFVINAYFTALKTEAQDGSE